METLLAARQFYVSGLDSETRVILLHLPFSHAAASLTGVGAVVQVLVAQMSQSAIWSCKLLVAYAARIYTTALGVLELCEEHHQDRSASVRVSRLHLVHAPPRRLAELVKDHAILANGPHRVAAGVVRARLTVRRMVLEGWTVREHGSGVIGGYRRILGK